MNRASEAAIFEPFRIAIGLIVVFVLAPMAAEAQNLADRDAKGVADYVLTDAGLTRYAQAARKLQPLMGRMSQDASAMRAPLHVSVHRHACKLSLPDIATAGAGA